MANIANDASTTSAAIVDTHVRSREITRLISAVQPQTFATPPPAPTHDPPLSFPRDVAAGRSDPPAGRRRGVRAHAPGVGPGWRREGRRRVDGGLRGRRRHRFVPRGGLGRPLLEAARREDRTRLHARLAARARQAPPPHGAHGRDRRRRVRHLPAVVVARLGSRPPPQAALVRVSSPAARDALIAELREHALVIGEVTLTSGRTAQYLIDAKRAILRPLGFRALGELVAEEARALEVSAVGGITMGADPIACAALAGGADVKAFFVRKERKEHGLARWIEGPPLEPGERCLVVEDVVTTGGSTIRAIERVHDEGHEVVGVLAILDRLAGGGDAIREALAPDARGARYTALTTIDDVYPEPPDR